ncbi:hypothetical protein [Derxia gummosa]|uniref:Uncharacterized protein n=1 Tax=Derxia gummosa DSM 723 TaxID=1121388 RepID=A0A8B6X3T7_9BURK|nr:hypothetical protein [Derxia gummosa]
MSDAADPVPQRWRIGVHFDGGGFRKGSDPLSFLRYLGSVGRVRRVRTLATALAGLDQPDLTECRLGFELELETTACVEQIRQVFVVALEVCELDIAPA